MAEPLWTVGDDADSHARGGSSARRGTEINGISIDSRTLGPGEAFPRAAGANRDGHGFVEAALGQGAACAIVEHGFKSSRRRGPLLRVADTLAALNDLGAAARAAQECQSRSPSPAASARPAPRRLSSSRSSRPATCMPPSKSYNNHWGVPLSLANMRAPTDYGVFEAGMNHAGELVPLSKLIQPHIAIVTTVAPVHLGFFRSVEAIADAKAEILEGVVPGGAAILNRRQPAFRAAAGVMPCSGRSGSSVLATLPGREARVTERLAPADGSEVTASILGETVSYRIGSPGAHLVQNSLAVLAAAKLAGADLKAAARALAGWKAQTGRGAAHRPSATRTSGSPSSTRATTPIRRPCARRWRRSG